MDVTRELVVPATPEEVWDALTDPARLEEWFANDVELDLERGEGVFRWDTGDVRRARVEEAEEARRLAIRWWDEDEPDEATRVTFDLEEAEDGTRLVVTETAPEPSACAGEWGVALELHVLLRATLAVA